ncbi:1-acyl-sn-glycerol-3-phosphate acyltransferase [Colwellia sp. BRX10-3]|uniref:1-acyl-sn-glycerol-3-phosphate acyltransferase n=1 Tax=Colwellia sp. BRX10-3 TaxID=2759844 RepID=UPI0015F6E3D5|nr:1-acyl-sn-glycerol-3-phosphate acyltransferase [Colwellia sp. BRX10-3]MBA6392185.1 1-acyl-sn-glycerol-3-phosphate acyltransferase [Colwellia sp. BRX10-3]
MAKKSLSIRDKTIFDGIFTKYFLKFLFTLWFKITGWKLCKNAPEGAGVAIAAPHTSNWDFFYALGAAIQQDVKIYFSIKDSLCRVPVLGTWLMYLGAIPIDRSEKGVGQVQQIKDFIDSQKLKRVFFLFTPEGTRGAVPKWKTGFYHVAQGSGLPIFLAKVDYLSKESGVFHTFTLTENKEEDIKAIQASYKSIRGKFPLHQFPPYTGSMPKLSETEAKIIKAMYSFKGVATKMEITAKAKLDELSTSILDFLIEKGMLEKVSPSANNNEPSYQLTFEGKGCFLHLSPSV